MKTKLFTLLLAVAASVGTMFAEPIQIGDLYYYLYATNQTAEVTYQLKWDENNYKGLTTANIPASVTYNSVSYSVTSIGDDAFEACTSLTSVTIPNSVTSIGGNAFYGCSGLTSVTIGNSVTSIGGSAFYGCSGLTSIIVENGNSVYDSRNNCNAIIETATNTLIVGCKNTIIPNSVTSIGGSAFYGCRGLTSVTIPNSVTSIGGNAFYGVLNIVYSGSATGSPWGAKSVNGYVEGYLVYSDATKTNLLACSAAAKGNIEIPNGVSSIGSSVFYGCSGLTSVTIPNSVTSIGYEAFSHCQRLTSVTIPNSVTSIGGNAFYLCRSLTSVTIPNSVTSIGGNAFYEVPNIVYSGSATGSPWGARSMNVYVDGYLVYSDNTKTNLLACSSAATGDITIPNSVTSIGYRAFNNCKGLTSVTIGNSVTSIGRRAFYNCKGLTSVTILNSVTSIGYDAFEACAGLTSVTIEAEVPPTLDINVFEYANDSPIYIYVPCGALDAYKTAWTNYASRISYAPLPYKISTQAEYGSVGITSLENYTICDEQPYHYTLTVTANYGYHFAQWSDGNTDNPRTIVLASDTTFTAEFAKNSYTISTTSANPEWGTAAGGKSALYLDEIEISATPNYGYHFVKWNDNNTSNPRTVSVTEDKTYTATFAKNVYSITKNAEHGSISGSSSAEYMDEVTLTVSSDYGYHFSKWSDGNTDNPRTIVLTQDTTFTAEFAKNSYTISTTSANPEWGTTAGDTAALYLDEVEISATANYGYHFVRWNDYNTSNPRTVSVTEDKTFTATFAKNVYYITKNAEHGSISGNNSAEYLDFVTLTVTPDYGYHFVQWSDGLKDNPRIFQITSDTTFTAEFAYDRVGTCGKDLALVWSYDPNTKVLTIGNAGSFTENMQFGVEAPNEMEELVIGNSVTAIGANAFAGIETLKKVSIGESVKTIGEQAFYNCVNLETIFNYRPTPTNTYSNAFDGVDKFECTLYVLPSSIDMYKAAAVWRDFYYTYAIGAKEATVTTNDVKVEPQNNAATVTWPTSENAASYTIQITKDGVVFCTLIFNANGQLTGIAFAPSRDGQAHAPQAIMTANGLQFTVTGLNSNTQYGYSVTAKDANDQPVATYSGEFTTTSEGTATGVEEISSSLQGGDRGRLILHNGQIFILRGEKVYTLQGQEIIVP